MDRKIDNKELEMELLSIHGKEKEIEDRFYKALAFGTGGLRGVIGAGTNRMNVMGLACTHSTVIKTIVTTDIVFDIAKDFWADVIEVLNWL